jgi:lysine-specific demethylase 3
MQEKFCLATAYKDAKLSRCTSCSRRNGMDTCRFRDIRFIKRDGAGAYRGIGFKTNPAQTLGRVRFPHSWNSELRKDHVKTIKVGAVLSCPLHSIADITEKRVVAAGLLPVLQREIQHLEHKDTICRPREVDVRATCGKGSLYPSVLTRHRLSPSDTCLTSLFSLSWMCRLCGREACAECYEKLCSIPPNTTPASAPKDRRDPEKRLVACVPRESHSSEQFFPISRFAESELRSAVEEMSSILNEDKHAAGPSRERTPAKAIPEQNYPTPLDADGSLANLDLLAAVVAAHPHLPDTKQLSSSPEVKTSISSPPTPESLAPNQRTPTKPPPLPTPPSTHDIIPSVKVENTHDIEGSTTSSTSEPVSSPLLPVSPSTSASELSQRLKSKSPALSPNLITPEDDTPFHPTVTFSDSTLTEETFRQVWVEGRPLVVKGVLDKFLIKWTPQYFIEKYSDHGCTVIDCITEARREVTVGWFFGLFGKYSERDDSRVWKLKDWPPSTDFKSAFPELYDDFARAVPIPSYCRRDGVLNIASHFPPDVVAPDLGTLLILLPCCVEANLGTSRPKDV